jgi:predicted ATPase
MPAAQRELFEGFQEPPLPDRFPAAFLSRPAATPRLAKIGISSLKGLENTTVEVPRPLCVLTGPNNSGKSTILQAVLLGFDALRRCVDTQTWRLRTSGRAVTQVDFLRVNEPRDLWHNQQWTAGRAGEKYIRVELSFDNGVSFVARIRFLYGALNIGITDVSPSPLTEDLLKAVLGVSPVFLPPSGGAQSHEAVSTIAQLHYILSTGDPGVVLRNILLQLQRPEQRDAWNFLCGVARSHFGIEMQSIAFDEKYDLELRAPYREGACTLDLVSGGAGFSQVLQIVAVLAWLKPGLVLLDEPDAHLHPSLQSRLLDFLLTLSSHFGVQIILSTHSKEVISQAPLNAIVPVDASRRVLQPIASMEHLLLEYERQGTITNVDLALLYQTRRCLFVEGQADKRLLPKLAEHFGRDFFAGKRQVVLFDFKGVDNLHLIPQLVRLFQTMIGAPLSWGVVRDRDANLPDVIDEYVRKAQADGIANVLVWPFYCLENLLLDPSLVHRALLRMKPNLTLTEGDIAAVLDRVLGTMQADVGSAYVTKAQVAYRNLGREGAFEAAARDAIAFLGGLQSLPDRLRAFPGKKVFGQMVQELQNQTGINIRLDDLADELDVNAVPQSLQDLFAMIGRI